MQTQPKNAKVKIIGKPATSGASSGGYILYEADNGTQRLAKLSEITNITFGDSIAQIAMRKFGIGAYDANMSFEDGEDLQFKNANIPLVMRCFHLASQGYSIDMSEIMLNVDSNKTLPLPYTIGSLVAGKGIYAGIYKPDHNLNRIFNVYAAPKNYETPSGQNAFTHSEALLALNGLQNWHGHDASDNVIKPDFKGDILRLGEWHLPSTGLMECTTNKGLSGIFDQADNTNILGYLSSYKDHDNWVYYYSVANKDTSHTLKDNVRFAVRPVRYEIYEMPTPKRP